MTESSYCEVDGCDRPTHSGGRFCAGHAKRVERGQPTSTQLREHLPLRERVLHLAIGLADADSDNDNEYERAWDALEHAVTEWADHLRAQRAGRARWNDSTPQARHAHASMMAFARWRREVIFRPYASPLALPTGKRRPSGGSSS